MRRYSYITIGQILERLHILGCNITRTTFKRLMKKELLFQMKRTANGFYVCSPETAEIIVKLVLENYAIEPPQAPYKEIPSRQSQPMQQIDNKPSENITSPINGIQSQENKEH